MSGSSWRFRIRPASPCTGSTSDRFKEVNDSLGHPAGDALLKSVAERLRKTVRQGDFVARLGGDEFAIIQTGAESEDQAMSLAGRVLRSLTEP